MDVNRNIVEQNGNQSAKVMAEYVEQGGGGGGGSTSYTDLENKPSINGVELDGDKTPEQLGLNDYENLNSKPQINGVELSGDKTGKELKLDDVDYVSTFEGVTGNAEVLYYLDTEYDTYKVGFYRFFEAHGEEPAKFVRIDLPSVKYVSTFDGVTGSTEALYYLDTAYNSYEVGFYRYIEMEESGVTVGWFVPIDRQRFKYVSTFTGEVGDLDRLYYLDTNYDEYTIGFYRYIEVEESGVTVGRFVQISNPQQLQVTYAKLKSLRDSSKLVAGMRYRITDYACTTTQDNTQSANHPFDIIVTADSENTLNEEASAALHEGDTYFANNDLTAWKLKYCLDNDTSRFAWADAANGKGVVYYMKDEFNNECPYDFKNMMFKRKITLDNGYPELDLEGGEDTWCYTFTATKYNIRGAAWSGIVDGSLESPHGHMSDEGFGTYHHNIIKEYIEIYNVDEDRSKAGLAYLSNNVFLGYFEYNGGEDDYQYAYCSGSNTLGVNCHSNTFGNSCTYNTFGSSCNSNTLGNSCIHNTFKNLCQRNTFGNICTYNTIGNDCHSNTFGSSCNSNTLGDSCQRNTFGNSCQDNTFKNLCQHNTFGNSCQRNTFGNDCTYNTFGNSCTYNTFGNSCSDNTFGNSCTYNTFGNDCHSNTFKNLCQRNTFGNDCHSNTFGNSCTYNTFGNDCHSNTLGDGCSDNTLGDNCQRNTFGNYFQRNTVFNAVRFCRVTGGTEASPVKNAQILSGTHGSASNRLTITFAANKDYTQYAAKTTAGKLRIWNIADEYEESNIIDVTVLPTTDIDTQALYRLTTTHYYHNDTELADAPQGYKSLNEEALVADENGLTAIEGETSTTTPWAEVTDAMIATLVSGSLVATCEFGEAGFFKTDADEYDYAGNFSTADTYTLWHNATGEPTDWLEVDSVDGLVIDGVTTENVNGELQANAIIDVDVFPTTNIKEANFYRKREDHFIDASDNEVVAVAKYICDGEHLEASAVGLIDKSTGTPTPWAALTDTIVDGYVASGYCRVTEAIGNTPNALYFIKTGTDAYAHLMCMQTKSLYHHEDGAWKPVSEDSVPDGVTIETVANKLQANAIVDVTTLPTTGIKAKTIYRMLVDRYFEDGTELPDTPSGYLSIRPAIVIIDENGITDNGTFYAWADITDDQIDFWVIRRQISQVYAADLMTMSTCFRTAANHYVYKDHVTEEGVYELYHNPTETANAFIKLGGGAASVETDNVTTQKVDGKLQANAIIEVQTLPATGYKQNSLYRMLDTATQTFKRYYYNGSTDPLPTTPTFYKGDGEHIIFNADGYTLNGNPGSYSSITQITIAAWTNNGWVSETADFSEAGMFRMPGSLAVYDSTTKLTEEDYVVTAEMDKVFKRVQGGWECISYIQLEKEQYDILSEAQKNDGTLYIVNDEED